MQSKVTIYDIAEKLKISTATVSRALNNSSKLKQSTLELIQRTADEMGYQRNIFAKALKSGKSNTIGIIVPRIDINFFSSAIRGIQEELNPNGYQVVICQTYDKGTLEVETINSLINSQVDGILMSISNTKIDNSDTFKTLVKKGFPFVFFDRKKDIEGISSVTTNDFEAGYIATEHLIKQGCKRVAHLTNNHALDIFKDRFLGYKKALEDYGLEFDSEIVIKTPYKIDEGKKHTRDLLALKNPPDGIFAVHDYLAFGAIQEIKAQGKNVPDDICVMGFSNEPFAKFLELSITTVNQSPLKMGKFAAQALLEQINNPNNIKVEKHVVLTPELLVRKSTLRQ
ncbi:LacI family transcriptional regulator [Tamlana nanhaiensis]|uniref:LacI family transcriptional regulator n=1 Tax=Neotamlana nanhaiensis TaxID=1382798 RepID=A0A0D7W0S9_9FLAO|nr:LacI family DNA-binding transcriptional regulator [Tamlana nanhaiensis]KJD31447.1 LacI family transcriptional regulator [Tamlana nanhaiensis]